MAGTASHIKMNFYIVIHAFLKPLINNKPLPGPTSPSPAKEISVLEICNSMFH